MNVIVNFQGSVRLKSNNLWNKNNVKILLVIKKTIKSCKVEYFCVYFNSAEITYFVKQIKWIIFPSTHKYCTRRSFNQINLYSMILSANEQVSPVPSGSMFALVTIPFSTTIANLLQRTLPRTADRSSSRSRALVSWQPVSANMRTLPSAFWK